MARRQFAPTHDLCARMRFIPTNDSAWDEDRIMREGKTLGKDETDPDKGHVFWRYQAGRTRYDLDADGLRDYIDFGKNPETWLLRRVPWETRETIFHLQRQGKREVAMRLAYLRGCVGLENPTNEAGVVLARMLAKPIEDRTPEVEEQILRATEDYSASAILEVGEASIRGSQDLSAQEKKVSATQHGPTSPVSSQEA